MSSGFALVSLIAGILILIVPRLLNLHLDLFRRAAYVDGWKRTPRHRAYAGRMARASQELIELAFQQSSACFFSSAADTRLNET